MLFPPGLSRLLIISSRFAGSSERDSQRAPRTILQNSRCGCWSPPARIGVRNITAAGASHGGQIVHDCDKTAHKHTGKALKTRHQREIGITMKFAQKARVATIGVLAAILLAGCAAGPDASPKAVPAPAPSSSAEQPEAETPEEAFAAKAKGTVGITVIEVVGPGEFVVEPNASAKEAGLGGQLTVTFRKGTSFVVPAIGECGYDESLAFAKQYFAENPDEAYVIEGNFGSNSYREDVLRAGFAYFTDPEATPFGGPQLEAEFDKSGLWSSCPGFGA